MGVKVLRCQHEAIPVFSISVLVISLEVDHMPRPVRTGVGKHLFSSVRQSRQPKNASHLIACVVLLACCRLFCGVELFGSQTCSPMRSPSSGRRQHRAFSVLLQSGVSCPDACLVGVQLRSERSLHRLNALKTLCDLVWIFSNFSFISEAEVPKNKRTRYCTQKYPLLMNSPALVFH